MSIVSGTLGAVMGSNAQDRATDVQKKQGNKNLALQREMYTQAREDFAPYQQLGEYAIPYLEYYATGNWQPPTAMDTSNYRRATADDYVRANNFMKGTNVEKYNKAVQKKVSQLNANEYADKWYDPTKNRIISDSEYRAMNLGSRFPQQAPNIEDSPSYKYQQKKGEEAAMKWAAARGMSGATSIRDRMMDFNAGLAAQETDKQYGRFLDMVKIGTGASGAAGGSSLQAGQNMANAFGQISNAVGQAGANRASMWSGLGGASGNALGSVYSGYKLGKEAGWWGNSGAGAGAAAASNGSGAAALEGASASEIMSYVG